MYIIIVTCTLYLVTPKILRQFVESVGNTFVKAREMMDEGEQSLCWAQPKERGTGLSLYLIPSHGEGFPVDLMNPGGQMSQDGFDPKGLLHIKEL